MRSAKPNLPEMSFNEIGKRLGMSRQTVYVAYQTGMRKLRHGERREAFERLLELWRLKGKPERVSV